jgi:NifU-like protein
MTLNEIKYSEKVIARSKAPLYRGAIFQMEADDRGLMVIESKVKSLKIYVMIDPSNDIIDEVKFFTYGGPGFTAIADILCEKLRRKSIDEAKGLNFEILESELRDSGDLPAYAPNSEESTLIEPLLEQLLGDYPAKKNRAIAEAAAREHRRQIDKISHAEADKLWVDLGLAEKLRKINDCMDIHIRQVLHSDGGDIQVLDLVDDKKVLVQYQGACNGCGSATGGTLVFIENKLREEVHYSLIVEPQEPDLY